MGLIISVLAIASYMLCGWLCIWFAPGAWRTALAILIGVIALPLIGVTTAFLAHFLGMGSPNYLLGGGIKYGIIASALFPVWIWMARRSARAKAVS